MVRHQKNTQCDHTQAPLPFRVAHPARAELSFFSDEYFELLKSCGYSALYLQDSPFDSKTGNAGPFKNCFHLIYLWDIAFGTERQKYRDYINEVCRRSARHGIETHLCCWEPRMPVNDWWQVPGDWHGHGRFEHLGGDNISFCWGNPKAVAFWKRMAREAFAALPGITGVHLGVSDNEASFCRESCPRCKGLSAPRVIEDMYRMLATIGRQRPRGLKIAVYDWWIDQSVFKKLPRILGRDWTVIGRSSQGHEQVIGGRRAGVFDMTAVFSGCGPGIFKQKKRVEKLKGHLVDMVAWAHPNEAWYLPAPPAPRYAIEKLNALRKLGARGWYDFDCGSIEPGSVAKAIACWSTQPDAPVVSLVNQVIKDIWSKQSDVARKAYALFDRARQSAPLAYDDPVIQHWSGRMLGLCHTLMGPFIPGDFAGFDSRHLRNWFAPFNLVTRNSIRDVGPEVENALKLHHSAWLTASKLKPETRDQKREQDAFEIFWLLWASIDTYFKLGQARLALLDGHLTLSSYAIRVRAAARDEAKRLSRLEGWLKRNPDGLSNPCWNLRGTLSEIWPEMDFHGDLLAPKRASLKLLSKSPLYDVPVWLQKKENRS